MLGNECAAGVASGELFTAIKGDLQWRDMRAEQHVGNDGAGDQVNVLRFHTWIDVAPDVAVGPAVEPAILNAGEIVRRQVVSQFIALVDGGPGRAGNGLDYQADGIAKAGSELPGVLAVEIADGYGCAHRRLTRIDVAAGSNRDQNVFAVGGDRNVARIVPASRQIQQLLRFSETLRSFRVIFESNETGHIADVNVVIVKRDSKGTPQAARENDSLLRAASVFWIAKDDDFVRASLGKEDVSVRRDRE